MGKWTTQYTDDVLSYKFRELICSSIERMKQEEGPKNSITYDAVVEDLDTGDMFCTKMVDLLVQELADRRHRSRPSDRRFISERTTQGLRALSHAPRVHKDRAHSRPIFGASSTRDPPLSSVVVDAPMSYSEDEEDPLLDADGARLNTELYDSYTGHSNFPFGTHSNVSRLFVRASPPPEESTSEDQPVGFMNGRNMTTGGHRSRAAATGSASASISNRAATDLVRRPSVRRRDFGDFTSRRRNLSRGSDEHPTVPPRATSPVNDLTSFWADQFERGSSNFHSPAFFSRRTFRRGPDNAADPYSTNRLRPFPLPSTAMPRLRRGGVQPPELAPFRSESASEEPAIPGFEDLSETNPTTESRSVVGWTPAWAVAPNGEIVGLPTPRSTSPEEILDPAEP